MGRKKKVVENVEIMSAGAEGKAIAKVDDKIVFIEQVVPGDVIDVLITRSKKSYSEGRAIKFHHYSKNRITAFCEHFGTCGGCKWQNLPYELQLKYKQQQVGDQLSRIGKVDIPTILPIIPSEYTQYYRNKLEFTFSDSKWLTREQIDSGMEFDSRNALGFHIPKRFDKILDIDHCYLQPDPSNEIRNKVRSFAEDNSYSFYNQVKHTGLLRNLIIRTASTGETMVIVCFANQDNTKIDLLLEHIQTEFPELTSIMYVINPKKNDTIFDLDVKLFSGKDYITEEMEGIEFRIGPKSFYQTNSHQAYKLYKVAREFASLQGNEVVYDLYTGTGTIANFIAGNAQKVVGLEYVPEAIEDAKINSRLNNIGNTSFFAGDIKDLLTPEFVEVNGKPDVVITDPPRAGMHQDVVNQLLQINPEKIVYVSCNPATQARDINLLSEKYVVEKVQPVDIFPHTHHVENVSLLVRH